MLDNEDRVIAEINVCPVKSTLLSPEPSVSAVTKDNDTVSGLRVDPLMEEMDSTVIGSLLTTSSTKSAIVCDIAVSNLGNIFPELCGVSLEIEKPDGCPVKAGIFVLSFSVVPGANFCVASVL